MLEKFFGLFKKAPEMTLEDASRSLTAHFNLKNRAMVGINDVDGSIRVYIHDDQDLTALPTEWQGWKVIWSSGHGKPVAAVFNE